MSTAPRANQARPPTARRPAARRVLHRHEVCIGCKACEVACKEWNDDPEGRPRLHGRSYDNTGALGASTWRHVAFVEMERPLGPPDTGRRRRRCGRPALAVPRTSASTASNAGCLEVCPTGRHLPHRGRHGLRPGRRLQRLRLLRRRVPVRRHRPARGRRRPFKCTFCYDRTAGAHTGVRQGVPDRVDPVRTARRAARARDGRVEVLHERGTTGPSSMATDAGASGTGRLLPARRQARGLRAAARPGDADTRRPGYVAVGRRGRRRPGRSRRRRLLEEPPMTRSRTTPTASTARTTARRARPAPGWPAGAGVRVVPPGRGPQLLRPTDPEAAGVEAGRFPGTSSPAAWPARSAVLAAGAPT